jgi:phosphate transport system substrate-binding protein
VKNKAGNFVEPTLQSTTAAGEGVKVPPDLGISIIDSPNPQAYPIASQTFVIVYKDMCKAGISKDTAERVKAFLDYGLGDGQSVLGQLQYAKLPSELLSKSKQAVTGLQCNGAALQ